MAERATRSGHQPGKIQNRQPEAALLRFSGIPHEGTTEGQGSEWDPAACGHILPVGKILPESNGSGPCTDGTDPARTGNEYGTQDHWPVELLCSGCP